MRFLLSKGSKRRGQRPRPTFMKRRAQRSRPTIYEMARPAATPYHFMRWPVLLVLRDAVEVAVGAEENLTVGNGWRRVARLAQVIHGQKLELHAEATRANLTIRPAIARLSEFI